MELATDLVSLALYDIVIFADDSGSMIFEEGGDRVDDLKLIVGRVAEVREIYRICQLLHARIQVRWSRDGGTSLWSCGQRVMKRRPVVVRRVVDRVMTGLVVVRQVATLFDDDGIMVRFMNNMTEGNGIRDAASANNLLQQVCLTLLHDSLPCDIV